MVKKKNAPALFELIHKGKVKPGEQLSVPDWMSGGRKPLRVPPVQAPRAEAAPVSEGPPASPRPGGVPGARVKPPRLARLREKLLAAEGKRLRVTISPTQAVLAGVAAVLVIAAVFVLGLVAKHSSRGAQAPQQAGRQPPAQGRPLHANVGAERRETLAAKTPEPPAPPVNPGPRGGEPVLAKGKYYLVVQGLMGMTDEQRADAEAIAQFLNARGEPVAVMVFKGPPRQYVVVSLRGFDMPDSSEAKGYLQAIEEQGRLYHNQGGRYDFRQGEKGWFVKP